MKIDPKLQGQLPRVDAPSPFADGLITGWKVTIPGGRPLATPAVVGGRVFVGGGFGSYDFYAFDALTGTLDWQYQTTDDGPTAAVVSDGFVAFNTESCELEVLTVNGERVWKKWLGDPLMSMPAVENGRLFMAFPHSQGDRRHYLACFALADGTEHWRRPIPGEIITAPVLADGSVYLATLDGTLCCFRQADGEPVWQEPKNATSSPVVWNGQCYFSQRREVPRSEAGHSESMQQTELLAKRGTAAGSTTFAYEKTSSVADYLDHGKRKARSQAYAESAHRDVAVGFAHFKGDAKMEQAMLNLGQGHVHSVWAYQGSKPFIAGKRMYSAMGDVVHCAEPDGEAVFWQRPLHADKRGPELLDGVLTPPAAVNGKLFVGSVHGDVTCLDAATGETLWTANLGEPVVFQPAVANGRVYAATNAGGLYCLETGDPADDGWLMWGGTPAHNGVSG
jgi:outer membrane protein assembly factor BamB